MQTEEWGKCLSPQNIFMSFRGKSNTIEVNGLLSVFVFLHLKNLSPDTSIVLDLAEALLTPEIFSVILLYLNFIQWF